MKQQYFHITLFAAFMALFAASCQKEEGTVTLGAEIQRPANADNKVYIDDHTPCWHNADQVYINNAAYPVMAATGSSARIENVTAADAYRAIFPASFIAEGADISTSASIPVTLPAVQQYALVGDQQRVDVPMGAYLTTGNTLQFHNLCSVVRVTVSNSLSTPLDLSRIELRANTAFLSGNGTATVDGGSGNAITLSSTASHSVSLAFGETPSTVPALGTAEYDIVVPEFSSSDVTITVYTTDDYYFELNKTAVALAHNTITTVTANVTELDQILAAELVSGSEFNNCLRNCTAVIFEYNSSVSNGHYTLSTPASPVPIYGNMDDDDNTGLPILRVSTSAAKIYANPDCSNMFRQRYPYNLERIDFGEGFSTSNVTNMSYMFNCCGGLESLDLSNFNTTNVTDMSYMFSSCIFSSLDLSNFNTANVTNMRNMFSGCGGTSIDLSSFNTGNVTNMAAMFSDCMDLTSLNLSNFNTANVTNMASMFNGCWSLTSLNLSNFNTANVTNMMNMFSNCRRLESLNLSNFNTANVTNMAGMFSSCQRLESLNLSNFNTANVTNMADMFYSCLSLTSLNLSNFNTSSVTSMSGMFNSCESLTSLNLSNFSNTNVTNMSDMFNGCGSLTSLNLTNFGTANVTNMSYMFQWCESLTTLNLSSFNTSNVETMEMMFSNCQRLSTLNLSNFNTANVEDMSSMFLSCYSLTNLNLSSFNTANVSSMNSMFSDCYNLVNLDLSHFSMSNGVAKWSMCAGLAYQSEHCTITCTQAVQTALQDDNITLLPSSDEVTFTWLRPSSK